MSTATAIELRRLAATIDRDGWQVPDSLIYHLSLDAWDALVTHLGEELIVPWERGRTHDEIVAALRAAAVEVAA